MKPSIIRISMLFVPMVAFGIAAVACGDDAGMFVSAAPLCRSNADCGGDARLCADDGRCVECFGQADCGGGSICDGLARACLDPCSSSVACGGDRVCAPRGLCVRCITDADCAGSSGPGPGGGFCSAELDRCVECRSSADCGGGTCDAEGECVECSTSAECHPDEPICDVARRECVECLTDAECRPGTRCDRGNCG
jgi:Cys-rich repeat protein